LNLSSSSALKRCGDVDFGEIGADSKNVLELQTADCRFSGTIGGGGKDPLRFIKYCDLTRGAHSSCVILAGAQHPSLWHVSHPQTRSWSLNSAEHPQRWHPHIFGLNARMWAKARRFSSVRSIAQSSCPGSQIRNWLVSAFQFTAANPPLR
jgi:hypothetical protein